MTAPNIEQLLAERYQSPEWALIFELAKGVGWKSNEGRIDAAAFNCWPSKGLHRIALEVKRTRGDFLKELENPQKRAWVEESFHQTYFVTPRGLLQPDEIPDGWGWLAVTKKGDKLRRIKVARHREIQPLPEQVALSALRSVADMLHRERTRLFYLDEETVTREALEQLINRRLAAKQESLKAAREEVERQRECLREERRTLHGPFAELGIEVRRHWRPQPDEPLKLEPGEVRQFVERLRTQVRAEISGRLVKQLREAHGSLGFLLRAAEESLNDDLPPSQQRRA